MTGVMRFRLTSDQEADAVKHFLAMIKPWREAFTEDNWPTAASHLHELLHRALVAAGAPPEHIKFLAQEDWRDYP